MVRSSVSKVFLTGFMASGKSVVGRALAERLALPFVDLDERIERRESRSVAEIFAAAGEAGFRRVESRALEEVCGGEPVVVALGGGTPTVAENRTLLAASGRVVWLNTPRSTILDRLERSGDDRPLYRGREQATALWVSRLAAYRECDLEIVPLDAETPEQIAARIARELG